MIRDHGLNYHQYGTSAESRSLQTIYARNFILIRSNCQWCLSMEMLRRVNGQAITCLKKSQRFYLCL